MGDTTQQYPGNVEFPTETEGPFDGIIYGEPVTVTIVYDPSQVSSTGLYEYETNSGDNGNIIFAVGGLTFSADMDNSDTPGWPIIQFNDGQFAGISYFRIFNDGDAAYQFTINGLDWQINSTESNQVVASGTISNQPS